MAESSGAAGFIAGVILVWGWNMAPSSVTIYQSDYDSGGKLIKVGDVLSSIRFNPLAKTGLETFYQNGSAIATNWLTCDFIDTDNWRCDVIGAPEVKEQAVDGKYSLTGPNGRLSGATRWYRYFGQYYDLAKSFIGTAI